MSDAERVVREAFAAYLAGDLDGVFERAHGTVEFVPVYEGGLRLSGRDEVRRFFEAAGDPRTRWWPIDISYTCVGDRVLVAGRVGMQSALGGDIELPVAWIFSVTDGLIRGMVGFVNERTAREVFAAPGGVA